MEGFIVLDYMARSAEAQLELATMVLNGTLRHQEHLVHGLENAPDALNLLFSGGNHGKTLVVVDDAVQLT
jgi:NADPH-dependent curcumin reductase CurA